MNIGGAVVRRLLTGTNAGILNLDKLGYASDLTNIEALQPPVSGKLSPLKSVDPGA